MFKKFALTISMGTLLAVLGSSTVMAGAVSGPQISRTSVLAHAADRYNTIYFRGGETAYVEANGDGSTTLHMTVWDANGNLINDISGYSPWIRWTPKWTGAFTIRVQNEGGVSNDYVLRTN